ncbi:unnamed protein product [Oppiella nova]|uniref:Uncharacterized protein n=1 Tax=Oppiella nova TaxID=334625 RepID=A0A7R9QMT9_9ACAR|nr:unnamed protein product [Oppiella nova]CAG2168148.1 unnamed protein product [Oppiella nova]
MTSMNDSILEIHKNIIKSPEDKREYKGLVLRNGLKVILISDVEADKSAASLSLNVGSMSDPWEVQGLAHLLERMLFLGSRKYPGDNDYHKYISSNGGSVIHTRTTSTYTAYLFDIATDYLPGALDRFAQFFIEPLFTESAMEREINAINSEYESYITNGHYREDSVDRCLSDPDHDYSKFQMANNESLKEIPYAKGIDVRQELLSFHERWYSANIMSLVVLGKECIQELQELVIPMFSGIRNNSAIAPKWTTNPFSDPYLRKQCFIVPIDDKQSMKIMFSIPDMSAHYRSKPKWYLDNLIGHEGPGSLLSELKSRNWCTQLSTGCCCGQTPGFAFFCINVDLTEQERESPNESFHNELRQTHEIDFRFYEMWSNMYFTVRLATSLHDYPIDECMSAKYTMDEFRPDLITDLLNHLTPDRMRVTVVSKQFTTIADQTEKWFSTKYTQQDIPPEKIQKWLNIGFNDNLALPPKNDFIPYDFTLKPTDDNVKQMPQMIRNTEFSRVWHLQDNQYRTPKAFYKFKLTNPALNDSPFDPKKFEVFKEIYIRELKNYHANWQITLLMKYTDAITTDSFWTYEDLLETVDDLTVDNVSALVSQLLSRFHIEAFIHGNIDSSEAIDVCDVFESRFKSALNTKPIPLSQHFRNRSRFKSALNTKPIPLSQHFRNRVVQLPDGSDHYFEATNTFHKTHAIRLYFQIGVSDTIINAKIRLLRQILKQPFFDNLMTKQQLGSLRVDTSTSNGVVGMTFTIESDYKPKELNERIEAFIQWVHKYIEDMSDKDFETQRQSVITRRLEKPKNLIDNSYRLWSEISSKEYDFNRDEIEVKAIKELTKQDIIAFFERHLSHSSTNRKKLTVSIISENPINEKHLNEVNADLMPAPKLSESIRIENITQFKTHLGLYSVRKPVVDVYANNTTSHTLITQSHQ